MYKFKGIDAEVRPPFMAMMFSFGVVPVVSLGRGLLKVHFACSWLDQIRREAPDFFFEIVY